MREIKFRGKVSEGTKKGGWVYGSYVADHEWAEYGIYQDELCGTFYRLVRYEVDPETVGQYIGFKDRRDKEIYEGDIAEVCPGELYEIIFCNSAFRMKNNPLIYAEVLATQDHIIGNIHDNPELLK